MSIQVTNTNTIFAKNAMKYLQGEKVEEQSTGKEILSGIPSQLAFGTIFEAAPAVSKAVKYKDLKGVVNGGQKFKLKEAFQKDCKDEFAKLCTGMAENEKTIEAVKNAAEKKAAKSFKTKIRSKINIPKILGKKTEEQIAKEAGQKAVTSVTKKAGEKAVGKSIFKGMLGEAKGFFLFNMLFQLGDIIPAFKDGGIKEGAKQTAKSAVFAGCDALAFTAGAKAGAAIGTAVGGPVGTVVGGVLGMVLGGVVSSLAEKCLKKVVGKSYSEKKAEIENQEQCEALANDAESMEELKTAVAEKIAEDQADGKVSKDTKIMLKQLAQMEELNMSSQQISFGQNQTNQTPLYQPNYQPNYQLNYQVPQTAQNATPQMGQIQNNAPMSQTPQATQTQYTTACAPSYPEKYTANYQVKPNTVPVQTPQLNNMYSAASGVNQGVRNNVLQQQANGYYEIKNIPRLADGSIDHSIYDATKYLKA